MIRQSTIETRRRKVAPVPTWNAALATEVTAELKVWEESNKTKGPTAWSNLFITGITACALLGWTMTELLESLSIDEQTGFDWGWNKEEYNLLRARFNETYVIARYSYLERLLEPALHTTKDDWDRFLKDLNIFGSACAVAFLSGNAKSLHEVNRAYCNEKAKSGIHEQAVRVAIDTIIPDRMFAEPSEDYYRRCMAFAREDPKQVSPRMPLLQKALFTAFHTRKRDYNNKQRRDYSKKTLPLARRAAGKRVRPTAEERNRRSPRKQKTNGRAKRTEPVSEDDYEEDNYEEDENDENTEAPENLADISDSENTPLEDQEEADKEGKSRGSNVAEGFNRSAWVLADRTNVARTYLECQEPYPIDNVANSTAAKRLSEVPPEEYPVGIQKVTFVEYDTTQVAIYNNLHEINHGGVTKPEMVQKMAVLTENDVSASTMGINRDTHKSENFYISNGDRARESIKKRFPELDTVRVLSKLADIALAQATTDEHRCAIKMQLGFRCFDHEQYHSLPDDQVFAKPTMYDTSVTIEDQELRQDLGKIFLYLQETMSEEFDDERMFQDERRKQTFADELSNNLLGIPGIVLEGGQVNITFLSPRDDTVTTVSIPIPDPETGIFDVEVTRRVGGIRFHTDANNCHLPGFTYLASFAHILFHEELQIYVRVWIGTYFRKVCSDYLSKLDILEQINTDIQGLLNGNEQLAYDNLSWDVLQTLGAPVTVEGGLEYVAIEAGADRITYLAPFASAILDTVERWKLNETQKFELVRMALLFHGNYNFFIALSVINSMDTCPFGEDVFIPDLFAEVCESREDLQGPLLGKSHHTRFTVFSGAFWADLKSPVTTTRQEAINLFNHGVRVLMDLCSELNGYTGELPDAETLGKAVAKTVSQKSGYTHAVRCGILREKRADGWKITYCGGFTAYLYMGLLIMTGCLQERYVDGACYTEVNQNASYSARLRNRGITSAVQQESLVRYLATRNGVTQGIIENVLCKRYRIKSVKDFYWRGMWTFQMDGWLEKKRLV